MIKFGALLCLVNCLLFCNANVIDPSKLVDQIFIQAINDHRKDIADGFGGIVQPLDPLHLGTFEQYLSTPLGKFHGSIENITLIGLTSFDTLYITHLENGSTKLTLHVPQLDINAKFSITPAILGVSDGSISATLNDIDISITSLVSVNNQVYTVTDVNAAVKVKGITTDIQISGKNIGPFLIGILKPIISQNLGKYLNMAVQDYQSAINEEVQTYINKLEQTVRH